jgi:hypothetical protein
MADQSTIIELTIDLDKAVSDTVAYGKRVDELKASLDALRSSQDATTEEIVMANAEYKAAKDQLSANEKVLKQITAAEKEEAGTLEKVTAQSNQLRLERNKLNLTTDEGKKRLQEINTQLDANSKFIKDNSDKQKQQNLNVGNYGSALDGVTGKLSAIPGPAGGVINSFMGMTKAAWAFVATPIGAIIAAIVLGVTALINIFKAFDPVLDRIQQGMAAVSAVITVLKEGVIGLITGQKSLNETFEELGDNMSKAATEAIRLKKAQQELDDMNWLLIESDAKSKRQIDELLLQSKDRTKSEQERIELIDEAVKKEEEAYEKRAAIGEREYELALGKITTGRSLTDEQIKQLKEVGVQAAINLKDTKGVTDAEVQAFAEAIAKRERLLNDSVAIREKAINRQNVLIEKSEEAETKRIENIKAAEEKAAAEREKQAAAEEKRREKEIQDKKKAAEDSVKALEYEVNAAIKSTEDKYKNAKFLTQQLVDEEKARQEQVYALEKSVIEKRYSEGLISKAEYDSQLLDLDIQAKENQRAVDQEWSDIRMQDQLTAAQMRYDAEMQLAEDNLFSQLELERAAMQDRKAMDLELIDQLAINEDEKGKLRETIAKKYAKADLAIEKAKTKAKLSLASDFAGNIATIAGEGSAVGKAAAVAAATINTYQAATGAYASLAPIPVVGPVLGIAAAGAAVAAGIANVKKILAVKTGLPGDNAGGGGNISAATASATTATPSLATGVSPTIGQGIVSRDTTDTTGQIKQAFTEALEAAPVRTAVVVDQVTAAQNIQVNNNIAATI